MTTARPGHPTTRPVAEAIESLRNALFREYGIDYAFSIVGRGYLIGASNAAGVVEAVITGDDQEIV